MQKFYSVGAFLAALVFSVGVNYSQRGDINAMKLQEKLYQCENRLLKDEIREYEQKAISTRTYEEGLAEGLQRSSTVGYTDGYHAAMTQIEQNKAYFSEQERLQKERKEKDHVVNNEVDGTDTQN